MFLGLRQAMKNSTYIKHFLRFITVRKMGCIMSEERLFIENVHGSRLVFPYKIGNSSNFSDNSYQSWPTCCNVYQIHIIIFLFVHAC